MATVIADMSMSLDGFLAGPGDDVRHVFAWTTKGAIEQAKAVAGDKIVGVASTTIAQQCLNLGLLDGIRVSLVPVLLGSGIRFFDNLTTTPVLLDDHPRVTAGAGVTHLSYRVLR